ncbi:hypothetical protein KIW84_030591 [Lathyrus oleraceus]|uniref:Uncharacterized protein n=1 Tax=Pisum sativum TaxID=3888 RepID=A0A9D4XPR9_PEA|nr:hypothetical protein KIW84_030591 [Pisum sativum]
METKPKIDPFWLWPPSKAFSGVVARGGALTPSELPWRKSANAYSNSVGFFQVMVDEQAEDILKEDSKQKKQISKGNKDQEGRHHRYDPIPVSYTHLLPILVNAGAIMPKQTESAKLPYGRKHDPHATCGYHAEYMGNSTEVCHALKIKVQELIDQNLLCFTPVSR